MALGENSWRDWTKWHDDGRLLDVRGMSSRGAVDETRLVRLGRGPTAADVAVVGESVAVQGGILQFVAVRLNAMAEEASKCLCFGEMQAKLCTIEVHRRRVFFFIWLYALNIYREHIFGNILLNPMPAFYFTIDGQIATASVPSKEVD